MARKNNSESYYILKIKAEDIVANKLNIAKISLDDALKQDELVSIGDCAFLKVLRHLHCDYRNAVEINKAFDPYKRKIRNYKKVGKINEYKEARKELMQLKFIDDLVEVSVKKNSDFNKFRVKGFYLNGKHYVFLYSGSSQTRNNKAVFANDVYRDKIAEIVNCGFTEKIDKFIIAKYNAYFALAASSVCWVRTPRVCVVKDFYTKVTELTDFISNEADKLVMNERMYPHNMNSADGQGLIDPAFAELWAKDIGLDYTPCSFVCRAPFVKGNLACFDFKEYAKICNITTVRDLWGIEYDINDIDILLSESQFKANKVYDSWQEYLSYFEKSQIGWGVSRYNKKRDNEYSKTNYQYIQSLLIENDADIDKLIKPTLEWMENICSGEWASSLIFAFGNRKPEIEYEDLFDEIDGELSGPSIINMAMLKNHDFLEDVYVQKRLYKRLKKLIDGAKAGELWTHGNYQFMISDPVAQCQAALGLEAVGLLKSNEIYSHFWKERKVNEVDLCRSPLVDISEHNICKLNSSDDASHWYKYLTSGIVLSIHDTATVRAADADFDGDIIFSTNDPTYIKCAAKNTKVITYDKGKPAPEAITIDNMTKTVMKGFNSQVGSFSNYATKLYLEAYRYRNDIKQYEEVMRRIKLLRQIVGQEIDRIKGADKPSLPAEWKSQKHTSTDNAPAIFVDDRNPYFFRYKDVRIDEKIKELDSAYNLVSKQRYNKKIKNLGESGSVLSKEEQDFYISYLKNLPTNNHSCVMNKICHRLEDECKKLNSDYNFFTYTKKKSMLPTFEDEFKNSFNNDKLEQIRKLYRNYNNYKQQKYIKDFIDIVDYLEDPEDIALKYAKKIRQDFIDRCQEELANLGISGKEFLFYVNRLSKGYKSFNWEFAWDVLQESIIELIPQGQTFFPVYDDDGEYEYLGRRYSLKDITDDSFFYTLESAS